MKGTFFCNQGLYKINMKLQHSWCLTVEVFISWNSLLRRSFISKRTFLIFTLRLLLLFGSRQCLLLNMLSRHSKFQQILIFGAEVSESHKYLFSELKSERQTIHLLVFLLCNLIHWHTPNYFFSTQHSTFTYSFSFTFHVFISNATRLSNITISPFEPRGEFVSETGKDVLKGLLNLAAIGRFVCLLLAAS